MSPLIVWFRQDLRLADNPALHAAAQTDRPLIALYVLDDETSGEWKVGGASRWWLHHSLEALKTELNKHHLPLILRRGKAPEVLAQVIKESQAHGVYWNRCYEPFAIDRDTAIKAELKKEGLEVKSFNGSLLVEPWEVAPKSGPFFRVFTPFWKSATKTLEVPEPLPVPSVKVFKGLMSEQLEDWALLPTKPDWSGGIQEAWEVGEQAAMKRLEAFSGGLADAYGKDRDFPAQPSTSRMSPHLHFGEISPRQIWKKIGESASTEPYRRELGWREFSYHLLFHFPDLPEKPFDPRFKGFQWKRSSEDLQAWQKGQTGYPIVDAGMRELWHTGWMHNRVRMITASFLIKDLMIHWKEGEAWFWDCLVDADLASNSASWQWVAGCGADAAPYFRIFNPVLQGERFDKAGDYVRYWVPEIRNLPDKYVHKPWEAPVPPSDYPPPMVDHKAAREEALERYGRVKEYTDTDMA